MEQQFDILNYLMTSDFSNMDDSSPEQFKNLLVQFRYEYRLLSGKNTSLSAELDKLKIQLENLTNICNEKDFKYTSQIAELQNQLDFTKPKLNRKLTFKERWKGSISND